MSITYLTQNNKPSWDQSLLISSSYLDDLMSSPSSKEDEKLSPEKEGLTEQKALKRSLDCDEPKANSNITRFTPTQVTKIRRKQLNDAECCSHSPKKKRTKEIFPALDVSDSTPSSSSKSSPLSSPERSKEHNVTPDAYSTSKSKSSPLNSASPRARIVFNEFSEWNHSTPTSHLDNSSAYYSSNSTLSESANRRRSRWSNSSNLISLSDSVGSDSLNGSFHSIVEPDSVADVQPQLVGYQMVGDSQFCRFGQQLLGLRREPAPNSPGRIGICVSGQTITDLHKRIKERFYPISDKVIVMIGTNDFLRHKDVSTICQELSDLMSTLQEITSSIIILTLPPIPKLESKQRMMHFSMLDKYNQHIRSLEDDNIRIADVSPQFMSARPYKKCRMEYFETYFPGPARRFDMIHLNRQGLELIRNYIMEHFL